MLNAIKPLVDSGIISEDTRSAITEAWDTQLTEAKEQIRAELREEFANRYAHDKQVMVEAVDRMITESLTQELEEFKTDKQALAEERVRARRSLVESSTRFNDFMVTRLAEEIKELRRDRKLQEQAIARMEQFITEQLAAEITEFQRDRQAVVEAKVRLVAEAKTKLAEMQQRFIARSARLVKESVSENLRVELTQLKEDVHAARENMFGRRLFEAFASEFATTHLSENRKFTELEQIIQAKERALQEATAAADRAKQLAESREKEIKSMREASARTAILESMLKPLNKEKATVMRDLLESVQTDKLQSAFDKYLPAVLGEAKTKRAAKSDVLVESRTEVTGDKTAKETVVASGGDNVIELKRLAGLK
jgi:hypothetical protein